MVTFFQGRVKFNDNGDRHLLYTSVVSYQAAEAQGIMELIREKFGRVDTVNFTFKYINGHNDDSVFPGITFNSLITIRIHDCAHTHINISPRWHSIRWDSNRSYFTLQTATRRCLRLFGPPWIRIHHRVSGLQLYLSKSKVSLELHDTTKQ